MSEPLSADEVAAIEERANNGLTALSSFRDVPRLIADWRRLTARVAELEAESIAMKTKPTECEQCGREWQEGDKISKVCEECRSVWALLQLLGDPAEGE